MWRHSTHPLCIRVPSDIYDYYNWKLTKEVKTTIADILKGTFVELVNKYSADPDVSKLIENLQKEPLRPRIEITMIEKKDETRFLELRKRLSKLEKELANLINENAGLKNELEACREQLKKPSDQLEKELAQIKREYDAVKKELENYKYYITVIYLALQEAKKKNDLSSLDKIIQYASGRVDNNIIEKAKLTAQNILR